MKETPEETTAAAAPLSPEQQAIKDQRAKLEALKTARVQKAEQAANAPAVQIAKLDREIREEEAIADAESAHGTEAEGGIGIVRMSQGIVILKKPTAAAYQRHSDAGSSSTVALKKLVFPCRVYPSSNELDEMIVREPYTLIHCGDMVTVLAGFSLQEFGKK